MFDKPDDQNGSSGGVTTLVDDLTNQASNQPQPSSQPASEEDQEELVAQVAEQQKVDLTVYINIKTLSEEFIVSRETVPQILVWLDFFERNVSRDGLLPGQRILDIPFVGASRPGQSSSIVEYPNGKEVVTQRGARSESNYLQDQNSALWLSDVASIVSGIAYQLYRLNWGRNLFAGMGTRPRDSRWPQQWAESDVGAISEEILKKHYDKIIAFIHQLRNILLEYQRSKIEPPVGFISELEFRLLLTDNLTTTIGNNIVGFEIIKNSLTAVAALEEDIRELLEGQASEYVNFFFDEIRRGEAFNFDQAVGMEVENERYVFYREGALVHAWYLDHRKNQVQRFLEQYGEELANKHIPKPAEAAPSGAQAAEDEGETEAEGGEEPVVQRTLPYDENELLLAINQDLREQVLRQTPEYNQIQQYLDNPRVAQLYQRLENEVASLLTLYPLEQTVLEQVGQNQAELIAAETISQNQLDDGSVITTYSANFLQSEWYTTLRTQLITQLLQNNGARITAIVQEILLTIDEIKSGAAEELQPEEPRAPEGAVVPPVADPYTPGQFIPSDQIGRLSADRRRALQYEAAWITNSAVYELFSSRGVDLTQLQQNYGPILSQLQAESFSMLSGYSQQELAQLFASPSRRQAALNQLLDGLRTNVGFQNSAQQAFVAMGREFTIPEWVSGNGLDNLTLQLSRLIGLDTPVATGNIQQQIDGLIFTFGVKNLVGLNTSAGDKDAAWFINNLSAEQLAVRFFPQLLTFAGKGQNTTITSEQFIALLKDPQVLAQIKLSLTNYLQSRAPTLIMEALEEKVARGFGLTPADEAALAGDWKTAQQHFGGNHLLSNFGNDINELGAENVAAGLVDRRGGKLRERTEIWKRIYQSEWDALGQKYGPDGQRRLYAALGLFVSANYGKDDFLDLPIQFLELKRSQIRDILELKTVEEVQNRRNEIIVQELTLKDWERLEDRLRIADLYRISVIEAVMEQEAQYVQALQALIGMELAQADAADILYAQSQLAYPEAFQQPVALPSGVTPVYPKESLGKAATKRLVKGGARKVINQGIDKLAAYLGSTFGPVGTGVGLAVGRVLKNKHVQNAIGTALAGAAIYTIIKTAQALTTVGGWVGGLAGGFIGNILLPGAGGAIGFIAGANIGANILPAKLPFLGGGPSAPANFGGQAVVNTGRAGPASLPAGDGGAGATAAASSQSAGFGSLNGSLSAIASLSVAAMAPGLMLVVITVSIIHTLLVIHSSFLVPVPSGSALSNRPRLESCAEESIEPHSCFFAEGNYVWGGSYNPNIPVSESYSNAGGVITFSGGSGHGSNQYWNAVPSTLGRCALNIPSGLATTGLQAPTAGVGGQNNVCFNDPSAAPKGTAYGYALDASFFPGSGDPTGSCRSVYLPELSGVATWSVGGPSNFGSAGQATIVTGYDGGGNAVYKMVVGHLDGVYSGSNLSPGDKMGEVYNWVTGSNNNTHVHIELVAANGEVLRPEDYFCTGS